MKKWLTSLLISVSFLLASKANGQSIVNTYTDPCDGKVYSFTTPIPNQVVVVVVRGQAKTFTYPEVISGAMTTWINTIFLQPCPVSITQTVAQQAAQAASSAASQAASTASSSASSVASSASSAAASTSPSSSSQSQSSESSTSSSSSSGSSESKGSEQSSSKGEQKSEKKSEEKKQEEKKKRQEERKANPPVVKADLTVLQVGPTVIPTFNVNMSKSLNEGMFSYGLNTSVRVDLKQAVVGGSTSNVLVKDGKLLGVTSTSITYVTDWNNKFIFYGWSFVRPLQKGAVTGLALSGNTLLLTKSQILLSPAMIVFYTKPYQISKKQVISPEIYLISSPLMFGQQDKKATYDPNISVFTGAGTDMRFSKRFKLNLNFKVNISTNSKVPVMSVFAVGSKISI